MKRALTLALALAGVLCGVAGAAHAQDATRGSKKVAMCEGCHQIVGYQTDFPQVYKVPMIAGQDAKYIAAALTAYRAGDRKQGQMRGVAVLRSTRESPRSKPRRGAGSNPSENMAYFIELEAGCEMSVC